MTLKEMQLLIIANRVQRGWPSATDLCKTTEGLAEEVGEWAKARKLWDRERMLDALCDIMVWCLGGFEIMKSDAQPLLEQIVLGLQARYHAGHH